MELLESALRALVAAADGGARLPTTRRLVTEYGVGPVTVQRVIRRLAAEGLVETRPGTGNFVLGSRPLRRPDFAWQTTALGAVSAPEDPSVPMTDAPGDAIALHNAYPTEDLLPGRLVRAALARVSRTAAATERSPAIGNEALRAWFAAEVGVGSTTHAPGAEDVIITAGGQSALSSTFRALTRPGESVVMESPTYWGAISAARQAGLQIVPIGREDRAPDPGELDQALRSSGATLFYAQPHFANPTGARWTATEAAGLLQVVRAHRAFMVEDDWAHDFSFGDPVRPLVGDDASGHLVYLRSLTKSVSPALRVAGIIARGLAHDRIRSRRSVDDLYVSGIVQAAALEVVADPGWIGHGRRMRAALLARRDLLAGAIQEHLGPHTLTALPGGGLNLWVRLDDRVDTVDLAARARGRGVHIVPGASWFPTEPNGSFVRLTYSGPRPEQYPTAARILAELIDTGV